MINQRRFFKEDLPEWVRLQVTLSDKPDEVRSFER